MRIIASLCIVLLCCLCVIISPAWADSVFECDKAKSTSGIQACLKQQLEQAQTRLTAAYTALDEKFDTEEQSKELKELQQTWLRYRDQECMWEAEQATSPSLKGINELSCMVRVSNDRADLLEITYMDIDPEVTRDYADASRWKNLLANDYTDVLWGLKSAQMVDVTCDDEQEIILQGVKYVETDMYEIAAQPLFEKQEIVAVIKNPAIGSAGAQIFAFDVVDEVNDGAAQNLICNSKVKLSFETQEVSSESDPENKSCESVITLNLNGCDNRQIKLNEKEFELVDRQAHQEEQTKEE